MNKEVKNIRHAEKGAQLFLELLVNDTRMITSI